MLILSGAFPQESQVPSTTEISATYRINPATVLKGMALLTDEGVLYKKRGLGMFVRAGAPAQIREKRRRMFYETYIVSLLEEAGKLGIRQGGADPPDRKRTIRGMISPAASCEACEVWKGRNTL